MQTEVDINWANQVNRHVQEELEGADVWEGITMGKELVRMPALCLIQ